MSAPETELPPDFIESACHFPHFVHIASQDVHAWAIEINANAIALLLADHCIGIVGRHILDNVTLRLRRFHSSHS